jgi:RNA chaperone Hfq
MDEFVSNVMHQAVMIYLSNGVRLEGELEWHDRESGAFGLSRNGITQLVMEHAIATIMPSRTDAY